ncbi:HAD family hydrolase [Longimicrobium sp.]|uniref:HAD family hydrolase n=1 Tax=Longimicrobium sp. TaxID=2029185 RepID=UPI002E32B850|nr:HAD family hydrolase [Longimicrobium sp.]HEX6037243.1 HAD family hydrolase [Longimicrobium sp.]
MTKRMVSRAGARGLLVLSLVTGCWMPSATRAQTGADPLASWNEGPAKRAIVDFVQRVTREGGPDFVPVEERIAAFDNDGTLWVEKPLPTEVYFVLARVRELAAQDPTLAGRQPFKAALEGDTAYFHQAGAQALLELFALTHAGMTQEEFAADAERFLAGGRHPTLDRPFPATAYQPMLELLAYLRANGFQTWISSGGTMDFIRVFAPYTYGVPPERTIGSELQRQSRRLDGRLSVYRLPRGEHLNDRDGKPVGIDRHIGRRPLLVAGNVLSGGDVAMMEYSQGRQGPSLQLLINHDDGAREFAYAEQDGASLAAARRLGFVVVSVRGDWRQVFPEPDVSSSASEALRRER